MSKKVVYFSRSGNSKRIAERIANGIGGKPVEITDGMDWSGIIGYIKAGFYTVRDKELTIKLSGKIYDKDEIIVVAPLWAGGPAQAARIFLKGRDYSKTHLVLVSKGSKAKNLLNRHAYASVIEIVKSEKREDALVNELIAKFKKA